MPAIIANARDFLFSTDFPIDKIIGHKEGSVSVGAGGSAFPSVPHPFTFAPLYTIKWSTTPDFSNSYDEIGVSTVDSLQLNVQVDTSNVFFFINNATGSTVTFYYRILYFMPPDVNVTATPTAIDFEDFNLNTDYNYTKIYLEDKAVGSNATINHNLGYYPQVEVWYMRGDGKLVHLVDNELFSPFKPSAKITTSSLTLNANSTSVSYWYYKVYIDET